LASGWFFDTHFTQRRVVIPPTFSDAQRSQLARLVREAVARQADLAAECPAVLRVETDVAESADALVITHEAAAPLRPDGVVGEGARPDLLTCEWIADALFEALAAAERARVVHGGIQLEAVYLDRLGCVKLGDFGIAAALAHVCADDGLHVACDPPGESERIESGRWMLAPATDDHRGGWLAPFLPHEHFLDTSAPTLRYDQFAAGVVLFLLASGHHPYEAEVDLGDPTLMQRWIDEPTALADVRADWREPLERAGKGFGQAADKRLAGWAECVKRLCQGNADARFASWSDALALAAPPPVWAEARSVLSGAEQLLSDLAFDEFLSVAGRWIDDDAGLPPAWRARLEQFIAIVERDRAKLIRRHELDVRLTAAEEALALQNFDEAAREAAAVAGDALADDRLRERSGRIMSNCRAGREEAERRAALAYGEYIAQAERAVGEGRLDDARTTLGALTEASDLPAATRTAALALVARVIEVRLERADEQLARRDFDAVRRSVEVVLNDATASEENRARGGELLARVAAAQLELAREQAAAGAFDDAIESANAVLYSGDADSDVEQAARALLAEVEATQQRIAVSAARLKEARELLAAGSLDKADTTLAPLRSERLTPAERSALDELDAALARQRAAYEACRTQLADLEEAILAGDVETAEGLCDAVPPALPFEDLRLALDAARQRVKGLRDVRRDVAAAQKAFAEGRAEDALAQEERLSSRRDLPARFRDELAELRAACEAALEAQRERLVGEARQACSAARAALERGDPAGAERALAAQPAGFALLPADEQAALGTLREQVLRVAAAVQRLDAAAAAQAAGDLPHAERELAALGDVPLPAPLAARRDEARAAVEAARAAVAEAHEAECRATLGRARAALDRLEFEQARTALEHLAAARPPAALSAAVAELREGLARATAARKSVDGAAASLAARKWDEAEAIAARLAQREDLPEWARQQAAKIARQAAEGKEQQRQAAIVELSELLDAADGACQAAALVEARRQLDAAAARLGALPRADAVLTDRLASIKARLAELDRWNPRVAALQKQAAAGEWLAAYHGAEALAKDASLPAPLASAVGAVREQSQRAIAKRQQELTGEISAIEADLRERGRRARRVEARIAAVEADALATQEHLDAARALRAAHQAVPAPSRKGLGVVGGIVGGAALLGLAAWGLGLFGPSPPPVEPNKPTDPDAARTAIAAELREVRQAWEARVAAAAGTHDPLAASADELVFDPDGAFPTRLKLRSAGGESRALSSPFDVSYDESAVKSVSDVMASLAPTSHAFGELFQKVKPPAPWPAALQAAQSAFDDIAKDLDATYARPLPAWQLAFEPATGDERRLVARAAGKSVEILDGAYTPQTVDSAAADLREQLNKGHKRWAELFPPDPWRSATEAAQVAFATLVESVAKDYSPSAQWEIELAPGSGAARKLVAVNGEQRVQLAKNEFTAETAASAAKYLTDNLNSEHEAWDQLFEKMPPPPTPAYPAWTKAETLSAEDGQKRLADLYTQSKVNEPAWKDLVSEVVVRIEPAEPAPGKGDATVTMTVKFKHGLPDVEAKVELSLSGEAWSLPNTEKLDALTDAVSAAVQARQTQLMTEAESAPKTGQLVTAHDALDDLAALGRYRPLEQSAQEAMNNLRSRLPPRWSGDPQPDDSLDAATGYPRTLEVRGVQYRLVNVPPEDPVWRDLSSAVARARDAWPGAPCSEAAEMGPQPWLLGYAGPSAQPGPGVAPPETGGLTADYPSLGEWLVLATLGEPRGITPAAAGELCRDPSRSGQRWLAGGFSEQLKALGAFQPKLPVRGEAASPAATLDYLMHPLVTRQMPNRPIGSPYHVRWFLYPSKPDGR